MTHQPVDRLYTLYQACDLLAVSYATINRLLASGKIAAVRIGSRRRIKESEISRYVESLANAKTKRMAAFAAALLFALPSASNNGRAISSQMANTPFFNCPPPPSWQSVNQNRDTIRSEAGQ